VEIVAIERLRGFKIGLFEALGILLEK